MYRNFFLRVMVYCIIVLRLLTILSRISELVIPPTNFNIAANCDYLNVSVSQWELVSWHVIPNSDMLKNMGIVSIICNWLTPSDYHVYGRLPGCLHQLNGKNIYRDHAAMKRWLGRRCPPTSLHQAYGGGNHMGGQYCQSTFAWLICIKKFLRRHHCKVEETFCSDLHPPHRIKCLPPPLQLRPALRRAR